MRLAEFIEANVKAIVDEAVVFSQTLLPAAGHLDEAALRDHLPMILEAIARDLQTDQSDEQELRKSRGLSPRRGGGRRKHKCRTDSRAAACESRFRRHADGVGVPRHAGIGPSGMASRSPDARDETAIGDIVRFNEAVDQAVAGIGLQLYGRSRAMEERVPCGTRPRLARTTQCGAADRRSPDDAGDGCADVGCC